ncbi:Succinyl-diaminopimelate desuccinylase [uncultured Gammaproteobacteria bacterium]
MPPLDPVALTQALIRCPSVTPDDAGALDVVEAALRPLGFVCHRLRFTAPDRDPVENLYARLGCATPVFCFAGHTDVVPPGDRAGWSVDPFSGEIHAGRLFGRGAVDMKGAVAAFIAAVSQLLAEDGSPRGSIALLITGDEEGDAVLGTRKVLDWLTERGERLDHCLVGEPTSQRQLGEGAKVGRRGSLTGFLTVHGIQGHVAYPQRADNPLPRLAKMLTLLGETPLDQGSNWFQPSTLALTTIDVGNRTTNVIPAQGKATFNIRYNDLHSADSLETWLRGVLDGVGGRYELEFVRNGESFLTPPGRLFDLVSTACERITGRRPEANTAGGTSDARFIKNICPVLEFGLPGETMHKMDENVAVADLVGLTEVYLAVLRGYFAADPGRD